MKVVNYSINEAKLTKKPTSLNISKKASERKSTIKCTYKIAQLANLLWFDTCLVFYLIKFQPVPGSPMIMADVCAREKCASYLENDLFWTSVSYQAFTRHAIIENLGLLGFPERCAIISYWATWACLHHSRFSCCHFPPKVPWEL